MDTETVVGITITDKQLAAISKGMKLSAIRECLPELEGLCREKNDAATRFADGIKAVAEKAGVHSSVLQAFVSSIVRDKLRENQEKAEQLTLLFEEIKA